MDTVIKHLLVFRSNQNAIGMYDSLFGGLYGKDWLVAGGKWALVLLFLLVPALLLLAGRFQRKDILNFARFLCFGIFVLLVFMLNQPVDEVFINLRHSMHLAAENLFSFNRGEAIEGIVDFLPYSLIGLLGKLYLPFEELTFLQSLLGGLLSIWACHKILRAWDIPALPRGFMLLALCVFPPLIYNSALGFSSALFCAAILWSIYFLHFSEHGEKWGTILLGIIPLIRLEGVLFALLEAAVLYYRRSREERAPAQIWKPAAWIFIPIAALSVFRFVSYGHVIPLPVRYKSSLGNLFFLKKGLLNLWLDASYSYVVPVLLLAVSFRKRLGKLKVPLGLLAVFVLPYYLSGGDWFSPAWGRYLLPLSVFTFTAGMALLYNTLSEGNYLQRKAALGMTIAIVVAYLFIPSSFGSLFASLKDSRAGRGSERVQQLSMLGIHLLHTSKESDKIASSEVATVMYFAQREALDLLGVANPKIVNQPVQEVSLFRRHNPSLIASEKPEFLYPGDYMTRNLGLNATREQILSELNRLYGTYSTWNSYFFGGMDNLLSQGYTPVFVLFANRFAALYFVSASALPHHLSALERERFTADPPAAAPTVRTL